MTQDQERELLPCPFCGGDAELDTRQGYTYEAHGQPRYGTAVAVYCRECSAQISVCREDVPDITPEAVTEMWNRRAALAAPQVQPEAVFVDEHGNGYDENAEPIPALQVQPSSKRLQTAPTLPGWVHDCMYSTGQVLLPVGAKCTNCGAEQPDAALAAPAVKEDQRG